MKFVILSNFCPQIHTWRYNRCTSMIHTIDLDCRKARNSKSRAPHAKWSAPIKGPSRSNFSLRKNLLSNSNHHCNLHLHLYRFSSNDVVSIATLHHPHR